MAVHGYSKLIEIYQLFHSGHSRESMFSHNESGMRAQRKLSHEVRVKAVRRG